MKHYLKSKHIRDQEKICATIRTKNLYTKHDFTCKLQVIQYKKKGKIY